MFLKFKKSKLDWSRIKD